MRGETASFDAVKALAIKALEADGWAHSPVRVRWDTSGTCTHARILNHYARGAPAWEPGADAAKWVELGIKCRACRHCLQARGFLWERRAQSELLLSSRSWLSTYTACPSSHYALLCEGILRSGDYQYNDNEEFRLRAGSLMREFTRYLKRVRFESKAAFRYMVVVEKHKSGLPHLHALFHEQKQAGYLRYHVLSDQWKLGFCHHKLIDRTDVAAYAAKYLAKENLARVRASISYGLGSFEWNE